MNGNSEGTSQDDLIAIPIIDISRFLDANPNATSVIVSSISSMAQSLGFFQITGHSVSLDLISRLLDCLAALFTPPVEKKMTIPEATIKGLMIRMEKSTEGSRFLQGPNQWPAEADGRMQKLSKIAFRIVALDLGLDETYCDDFPPMTKEMAIQLCGIGAHGDFGALTLLLQDGSEPSSARRGCICGELCSMVISPINDENWYGVAFFNEVLLDQIIECIPTCLKTSEKAWHDPVQVEAHLKRGYGNSY
ncbi:Clavaminate synthase-like protein [Thozetella sp. PMI_491]|nr:Clavaminate synthase-like protein [Thozetella sp. PMI_491]